MIIVDAGLRIIGILAGQPEKDEEAANILFLAVLVLSGVAGVSLLMVALFHTPVARLLGDERLRLWLWAAPVALFVNGMYQVQGVWFGRMKRFRRLAIARRRLVRPCCSIPAAPPACRRAPCSRTAISWRTPCNAKPGSAPT